MQYWLHDKIHRIPPAASRPGVPGTANKDAVLQRFQSELSLTPEQTSQIGAVLDDYRNYFDSLREQLDDVRSTGKMRILEILNPEQREKFSRIANDLVPGPPPPPAAK